MNTIKKGDPNMISVECAHDGMTSHEITEGAFEITGFPWMKENGNFNRIPERIMNEIPESLAWVAPQPSGGMIRFQTNSSKLSIEVELLRNETSRMSSQALLSGFDVYMDQADGMHFLRNLSPENNPLNFCVGLPQKLDDKMKNFIIYTPLQNPIKSVRIGLDENAVIEAPAPFTIQKPILFYGSSITCGFCASRPGLTYPAKIARELNANFINFGFGGNAKGDLPIARAISELDLSCVVIDYDSNAPSKDFLEKTHKPFFNTIRERLPLVPIVIVSAPYYHKSPEYFTERRKVIEQTYHDAVKSGDKNVYFINGGEFFYSVDWADFTVDCLHPNDRGFDRMAQKILPVLQAMSLS